MAKLAAKQVSNVFLWKMLEFLQEEVCQCPRPTSVIHTPALSKGGVSSVARQGQHAPAWQDSKGDVNDSFRGHVGKDEKKWGRV